MERAAKEAKDKKAWRELAYTPLGDERQQKKKNLQSISE